MQNSVKINLRNSFIASWRDAVLSIYQAPFLILLCVASLGLRNALQLRLNLLNVELTEAPHNPALSVLVASKLVVFWLVTLVVVRRLSGVTTLKEVLKIDQRALLLLGWQVFVTVFLEAYIQITTELYRQTVPILLNLPPSPIRKAIGFIYLFVQFILLGCLYYRFLPLAAAWSQNARPLSPAGAWRITTGNTLLLLVISAMVTGPVVILHTVIGLLVDEGEAFSGRGAAVQFLDAGIEMLSAALSATLSLNVLKQLDDARTLGDE